MSISEKSLASNLFQVLFPIHRSIAGPGLRSSLQILAEAFNLNIVEYPSGLNCFDWIVPNEWNPQEASIKDSRGTTIVDYKDCNLHLVSHSTAINETIRGSTLKANLHTSRRFPHLIPYVTAYYSPNWGFCLTQEQYDCIEDNENYLVCIKAESFKGSMTGLVSNLLASDQSNSRSYLISSYLCHPSLANDNLSGPILACLLWKRLQNLPNVRNNWFLQISPETIGALAWLKSNEDIAQSLDGAFVSTTCAGPGQLGFKDAFDPTSLISQATHLAFRDLNLDPIHYPFVPDGSDERQFSSPGYRIPCITITKDKYYEYDFYHTSGDDLNFISSDSLIQTLEVYWKIILSLEGNSKFLRKSLCGETRLGPHGLYPQISGHVNQNKVDRELAALSWVDWSGDGSIDLISLARRSGLPFELLFSAANKLEESNLGNHYHA